MKIVVYKEIVSPAYLNHSKYENDIKSQNQMIQDSSKPLFSFAKLKHRALIFCDILLFEYCPLNTAA